MQYCVMQLSQGASHMHILLQHDYEDVEGVEDIEEQDYEDVEGVEDIEEQDEEDEDDFETEYFS